MNEAKGKPKNSDTELVAVSKAYDLVRELTQRVGKFRREFRFLLGDRILTNSYDVLDLLIEAKYRREKLALLARANLRLEQMRFQVRLAHDEKQAAKCLFAHLLCVFAALREFLKTGEQECLRATF